jgi:predicted transglutaminase-like cysteine proteinase
MSEGENAGLNVGAERDYWGRNVLRGVANAVVYSAAIWGVVALGLAFYLKPVIVGSHYIETRVPTGSVAFCMHNAAECAASAPATLADSAYDKLNTLNLDVNQGIKFALPERTATVALDTWKVLANGDSGPCVDYVLTKRHRLIAEGLPAGAFSIGYLHIYGDDENMYHAVLFARMSNKILILDSLSNDIRTVDDVPNYRWLSHTAFGDPWRWEDGAPETGNEEDAPTEKHEGGWLLAWL